MRKLSIIGLILIIGISLLLGGCGANSKFIGTWEYTTSGGALNGTLVTMTVKPNPGSKDLIVTLTGTSQGQSQSSDVMTATTDGVFLNIEGAQLTYTTKGFEKYLSGGMGLFGNMTLMKTSRSHIQDFIKAYTTQSAYLSKFNGYWECTNAPSSTSGGSTFIGLNIGQQQVSINDMTQAQAKANGMLYLFNSENVDINSASSDSIMLSNGKFTLDNSGLKGSGKIAISNSNTIDVDGLVFKSVSQQQYNSDLTQFQNNAQNFQPGVPAPQPTPQTQSAPQPTPTTPNTTQATPQQNSVSNAPPQQNKSSENVSAAPQKTPTKAINSTPKTVKRVSTPNHTTTNSTSSNSSTQTTPNKGTHTEEIYGVEVQVPNK